MLETKNTHGLIWFTSDLDSIDACEVFFLKENLFTCTYIYTYLPKGQSEVGIRISNTAMTKIERTNKINSDLQNTT